MGQKRRILFAAIPLSGHLNPQLDLARYLDPDHYEIYFLSTRHAAGKFEDKDYTFISILDQRYEEISALLEVSTDPTIEQTYFRLYNTVSQLLPILIAAYQAMTIEIKQLQPDLVVTDFSTLFGSFACESAGVPYMTSNPSIGIVESTNQWEDAPYFLGGWKPAQSLWGRIKNRLGWLFLSWVKRSIFLFHPRVKETPMRIYRTDETEAYYSNRMMLMLGLEELEFNRYLPTYLRYIGPCISPSTSVQRMDLPDKYEKRVLVTFGTLLDGRQDQHLDQIKVLAQAYPTYLFILTDGKVECQGDAPTYEADNIMRYGYLSYSENFDQFDFVIHHGGAGILHECLKHAIPSLVLPVMWDQFDQVARLEAAGASLWLKKGEAILDRFTQLQTMDRTRLKQLQAALKGYDTAQLFNEAIDELLGGSMDDTRNRN